jgi:cell division protease FtsH
MPLSQVHAKGKPIPREGDSVWESDALLHRVAELTIGYAGADLANLLNEAAILMVRVLFWLPAAAPNNSLCLYQSKRPL